MNLTILDTGLARKDPYVIIDENEKVLAASYEENGEHSKSGLLRLTDEIATLRAQLEEAKDVISQMYFAITPNKHATLALLEAQRRAYQYLDSVKSGD